MYNTTGLTKARITELCARIDAIEMSPRMRKWPPILGLRDALTVTLTYLRRNRVQAELAEDYGVSQPTISRAISAITPMLVRALSAYAPSADGLDDRMELASSVSTTMTSSYSSKSRRTIALAAYTRVQGAVTGSPRRVLSA